MDTYRPEEQGVSQSSSYSDNSYGQNRQYGYEPNYNTTGGYNYDPNPYATGGYGANGYAQNGYDMGGGYESGNPVQMSGLKNFANIISNEVVAKSYLFMMVALFITAGAALTTSPDFAMRIILSNGYWAFVAAEIAIVCGANSAITKNKPIIAGVLFAVYSYMTGMLFSIFFVIYTGESLASVFFMCAGMFAVMAIYGMVTGKDLSSLGSICMMGLVGIIIAGVANMVFIRNGMFDFVVSIVGVLVFVGLTAYDANKTKRLDASASGVIHLNGPQALAYSRNRYIGTDFGRTERQRKVLSEVFKKLPGAMVTNSSGVINGLFPNLTTNLTQSECYKIALGGYKIVGYDMVQQCVPQEGTYSDATIRSMAVLQVDFDANKKFLKQTIYGE